MSQELFNAAQSGNAAQVKSVLEAGADHAATGEAGENALMHAAHGGHLAAVQLLIAAGADVNAQSPQGWTALAKAAYNGETGHGYVEVVEVLAMAGDGVKFEICRIAMNFAGVEPASLQPEVKPVGNGWISVIGYQARGYSLIAGEVRKCGIKPGQATLPVVEKHFRAEAGAPAGSASESARPKVASVVISPKSL